MIEQVSFNTQIKHEFSKDWVVYLYNDDITPIEFVVDILIDIFGFDKHKAIKFAYDTNDSYYGIVGKYPKKLAIARVTKALSLARSKDYNEFRIEAKEDK